eukprot:1763964-Rhodomonas_salina.4
MARERPRRAQQSFVPHVLTLSARVLTRSARGLTLSTRGLTLSTTVLTLSARQLPMRTNLAHLHKFHFRYFTLS